MFFVYQENFENMVERINQWAIQGGLQVMFLKAGHGRACWSAGNRLLCLIQLDESVVRLKWWDYSWSPPNEAAQAAMAQLLAILLNRAKEGDLIETTWPGVSQWMVAEVLESLPHGIAENESGEMVVYDKDRYRNWKDQKELRSKITPEQAAESFVGASDTSSIKDKGAAKVSELRLRRFELFLDLKTKNPELTQPELAALATDIVFDQIKQQLKEQYPGTDKPVYDRVNEIFRQRWKPLGREEIKEFTMEDVRNDYEDIGKPRGIIWERGSGNR